MALAGVAKRPRDSFARKARQPRFTATHAMPRCWRIWQRLNAANPCRALTVSTWTLKTAAETHADCSQRGPAHVAPVFFFELRPEDRTMNMTATYSPEDNKLRLYPLSRLPKELYERV